MPAAALKPQPFELFKIEELKVEAPPSLENRSKPPRPRGRKIRSPMSACVLDFIEGYGASTPNFIAEFYKLDRERVRHTCCYLFKAGYLVRWFFDEKAMYGLPHQAPTDPEILAYVPEKARRGRRDQNRGQWRKPIKTLPKDRTLP